MNSTRIPDFTNKSRKGMSIWFNEMSLRDLLFHPDDAPSDIITTATNKKVFARNECNKLDAIMREMFDMFGNDVYEIAHPIFMKRAGQRLTA